MLQSDYFSIKTVCVVLGAGQNTFCMAPFVSMGKKVFFYHNLLFSKFFFLLSIPNWFAMYNICYEYYMIINTANFEHAIKRNVVFVWCEFVVMPFFSFNLLFVVYLGSAGCNIGWLFESNFY